MIFNGLMSLDYLWEYLKNGFHHEMLTTSGNTKDHIIRILSNVILETLICVLNVLIDHLRQSSRIYSPLSLYYSHHCLLVSLPRAEDNTPLILLFYINFISQTVYFNL